MSTEGTREGQIRTGAAAHWGAFLSQRLTWLLLACASALGMIALLFPLFHVDPRETLVSVEGYFTTLTFVPAESERGNAIEFSIREKPGVVWVARGIRPVDQMLFVAREKQGMFVQLEVVGRDLEKIQAMKRGDALRISPAGVKTPQGGVYLVPGNEAQEGNFNRRASALGEVLLAGVLFGVLLPRLRRTWRESAGGQPAPPNELDPIWEWAMEAPEKRALVLGVVLLGAPFLIFSPAMAAALSLLVGGAGGAGFWRLRSSGLLRSWQVELATSRVQDREAHARKPLEKADRRHLKAVEILLQNAGGKVNLQDSEGHTPLWISARAGSQEAVELLLARGADPNLADHKDGVTPLMLAAQNGSLGMVMRLLGRKADVLLVDKSGKRALEHAQSAAKSAPGLVDLLSAETRKAEIVEKQRAERKAATEGQNS